MNNFFRFSLLPSVLIAMSLGVLFFITSCEKEKSSPTGGQESETTPLLPSCNDYCSDCGDDACTPRTILEAVTDTIDPENHRVNMILFHYAQAVREAAKNSTLLQYMTGAVTVNNVGVSASLHTLAQNNSTFASGINYYLRQSMSANNIYPRGVELGVDSLIADPTWDANTYLKNRLTYGTTPYEPVIYYLTKPSTGAGEFPATVLIAQEVNDCDDIAGWKGDVPSLVGETEAKNGNRLVLIVGPGLHGNPSETTEIPISAPSLDRTTSVSMASVRILGSAYRYETSGKSEIKGAYIRYNTSPVVSNEQVFFTKICKKDIRDRKTITNTNLMITDGLWDSNSHYLGFYEYDWYAQFWTLPAPCTTETIKGQRKFVHEWYNVDFCGAASTYFPTLSGGTATRTNTKSTFIISGI
jgi:hypothetical protein